MQKFWILGIFLLLNLAFVCADLNFWGYVYDLDKNPLNASNVSVYIYQMPNMTLVTALSTLTNESGFFNLTINATYHNESYLYKATITHYNGSYVTHISKSLPEFPLREFQEICSGGNKFYLRDAALLNITTTGSGVTKLENVSEVNNFSVTAYQLGLEWLSDVEHWSYLNSTFSLIELNSDFSLNNTLDITMQNIADFTYNESGGYYFVNTTTIQKWNSSSLEQEYDISSRNYSVVEGIAYYNQEIYLLAVNSSGVIIEVFNESFDLQRSYLPGAPPGKLARDNEYWYIASNNSGIFKLYKCDDNFNCFETWNFNNQVNGIEFNGSWYYGSQATSNISEFMVYGPLKFNYQIKDTMLGYPVASNFENPVTSALVVVPADRNYSIMIYPTYGSTGFPTKKTLNNITAYSKPYVIDVVFNTTTELSYVSGYAKLYNGSAGYDSLAVIAYILEAGNMVYFGGALPYNISGTTYYNLTSGFYNISLPGTAESSYILLFATAKIGNSYYGAFQNITLGVAQTLDLNLTLYPLIGTPGNITLESEGEGLINITTLLKNFKLQNASGSPVENAHIELELDYENLNNTQFSWMTDVSRENNGTFRLPVLNASAKLFAFSPNFAPLKKSLMQQELQSDPVNITLRSFNPEGIEGELNLSYVEFYLYHSNSSCSVPYPSDACKLISGRIENVSPMSIIIGGGKVDFGVRIVTNNITVRYVNVDMLASGPPDALLETNSTKQQNASLFAEAWRFGSRGPSVYDYVILGVPYVEGSSSQTGFNESVPITIHIPYLYGENFDTPLWNASQDNINKILTNDSLEDFRDYINTSYEAYLNGTGVECNFSDENLTSGLCYQDTTNNIVWFKILHFTGLAPELTGSVVVATTTTPSGGETDGGTGGGGGGGAATTPEEVPAEEEQPSAEEEQAEAPSCVENWTCTDWGPCMPEGKRYRTCTDLNACNTTFNKPPEVENCTYIPAAEKPEKAGENIILVIVALVFAIIIGFAIYELVRLKKKR